MIAIPLLAAGCGGDDDDGGDETVTVTEAETESEEATATVGEETTSVPEETVTELSEAEEAAEAAEIVNVLREFNRVANLGKTTQACNNYFSAAFLARLRTERECATALAGARREGGKVQLSVDAGNVVFENSERGSVRANLGEEISVSNVREIQFVLEDGAWKIDAVTAPF